MIHIQTSWTTTIFCGIVIAAHSAVSQISLLRGSIDSVVAIAIDSQYYTWGSEPNSPFTAVFQASICISIAGLQARSDGAVGGLRILDGTTSSVAVASDRGEAVSTRVHIWTSIVVLVAVPS